jgi:hypothetical protein
MRRLKSFLRYIQQSIAVALWIVGWNRLGNWVHDINAPHEKESHE